MSLTFKDGQFLQGSVGITDIVNTVSASHHVYGWLGGLDTVVSVLSTISSPFSRKLAKLNLDKTLKLSGVSGQILTGQGLAAFTADDGQSSFGGDIRTQLIGLTLCALAHECGSQAAYDLFTQCLIPALFDGTNELTDGLAAQLRDHAILTKILNEGASRRVAQRFNAAIDSLNIPLGDSEHMRNNLKSSRSHDFETSEIQFVGGFLKWLVGEENWPYRTRSALVVRIAVCLRAIGYPLGCIQGWNGVDPLPDHLDERSLLLVLGGSISTDPFMLGVEEITINPLLFVHHYDIKTIGALFSTGLYYQVNCRPEVFQGFFEETQRFIENMTVLFIELERQKHELILRPAWLHPHKEHPSPVARRLAAIYFPYTADRVAACYDSIADPTTLQVVLDHKTARHGDDTFPLELANFRVITASIVFAVVFHFMDEESRRGKHSTGLFLGNEDWLVPMCKVLDRSYYHGIGFSDAVFALAVVHSAQNPEEGFPQIKSIIGWRSKSYAVIPSLLTTMTPTKLAPTFTCIDTFLANIKVHEDGSIRDASSPAIFRHEDAGTTARPTDISDLALQRFTGDGIGKPNLLLPDAALYLSFEPPRHHSSPDLCLAARIGGVVIGTVGILDVLEVLSRSLEDATECKHQSAEFLTDVFNVKASEWVRKPRYKPMGRGLPTFISVRDDPAWALFLAGQAKMFNGRTVLNCVECSIKNLGGKDGLLVGYV